ncbi:MAG: hypothetical protein ACR2P9_07450 [Gammaproteobacteria bacterium]
MKSYIALYSLPALLFAVVSPLSAETHDDTQAAAETAEQMAPSPELDQTISDFIEKIKQHETEHGIYDPKTGEYLLSIGLLHQQKGNHQHAADALERSLQIQRVNDGLHSISLLIVLEQLIESNIASANWDEVDKNYHQLLWINRRNYDPTDPRLLPVVRKVGSWKLRAYREGLLSRSPISTLQESAALFSRTVAILGEEYGEDDPLLVDALYGEALANYQIAFQILSRPVSEFQGSGSPDLVQMVCTPIMLPNGGSTQSCHSVRVPNPSYHSGKQQTKDLSVASQIGKVGRTLQHIIDIHEANPNLPETDYALALVHLGDWNLLRNRRSTALEIYTRAYRILADAPDGEEQLAKIFGKPVSIPALRLPLPEVDQKLKEEGEKNYAVATFDVSRNGKPRNITITETYPPESKSASRKAKKSLRAKRYRPRFEDGQPVQSTGNQIRVLL